MSSFPIDLTGRRFERLAVREYRGDGGWLVQCDCGAQKVVAGNNLRNGRTRSCGCLLKDFLRDMDRSKKRRKKEPAAFRACSTCRLVKAASEFSPKRGQCKDCIRLYMRSYSLTQASCESQRRYQQSPAGREAQLRYKMAHPKPPKVLKPPKPVTLPKPPKVVLSDEEKRARKRAAEVAWVVRNRDHVNARREAYRRRYPEKHRAKMRAWLNLQSKELGNEYIKRALCKSCKSSQGLPRQLITPDLIELKREQLRLHRSLQAITQVLTDKEKHNGT